MVNRLPPDLVVHKLAVLVTVTTTVCILELPSRGLLAETFTGVRVRWLFGLRDWAHAFDYLNSIVILLLHHLLAFKRELSVVLTAHGRLLWLLDNTLVLLPVDTILIRMGREVIIVVDISVMGLLLFLNCSFLRIFELYL